MSETKAVFTERSIRSLKVHPSFRRRICNQVHAISGATRRNPCFWKELSDRLNTEECQRFPFFVLSVDQTTTRI